MAVGYRPQSFWIRGPLTILDYRCFLTDPNTCCGRFRYADVEIKVYGYVNY